MLRVLRALGKFLYRAAASLSFRGLFLRASKQLSVRSAFRCLRALEEMTEEMALKVALRSALEIEGFNMWSVLVLDRC